MSCFSPNYAFIGKRGSDGKKLVKVLKTKYGSNSKLACGKCIGCRLDYSNETANRCWLEAKKYKYNYFITLTYNEENLPYGEKGNPTIKKEHLTKFMKDVRQYYKRKYNHQGIRFYGCAEYGEKYQRPHFHLILFNLFIDDLKFYKKNFDGDNYYNSKTIERLWGKGYCVIGNVSHESIAYVARYVMKKQVGKKSLDYYNDLGIEKEFVRMSRRPGIARSYYDENKNQIYKEDGFSVITKKGVKFVKPPAYFDRLFDKEYPKKLDVIKKKRIDYKNKKDNDIWEVFKEPPEIYLAKKFHTTRKKALKLKRNKIMRDPLN